MNPETPQLVSTPAASREARAGLRFDWQELSGSLGDLGTFLPLAVALAITSGMDLGLIFIFAGLMHVLSGGWFRQPVPVQPMKAIAAVAITEGLRGGEVAAAGMLMGVLMVVLAFSGAVDGVARRVPKAVVRGIQLGVGVKLVLGGVEWLGGLPPLAVGRDSLLLAGVAGALLLWPRLRRVPVLLVVFVAGLVLMFVWQPGLWGRIELALPRPVLVWPDGEAWRTGLVRGALPQLPLTLLNSVIAVCALSEDLFPGRGLAPRKVAASVGVMNLISVPFGGMPMCHGAGGLAAQHRFGARTGGSVIMLGGAKLAAGLLLGAGLATVLGAYPRSILAVMLIFAGVALARPARDCLRGTPALVLLITAGGILLTNTAVGVVVGLAVAGALRFIAGRSGRSA